LGDNHLHHHQRAPRDTPRDNSGDNRQQVKRVLLVALAVNVSMTLLKLLVGLLSGSLAVLADAMHSATDGLSSLLGLLTNGLSDPEPDRDHPYGHHKYEALGALAIAAFILFTAFEILQTAVHRLRGGLLPLRLEGQELLLLLVVLGFNILLASYERAEGRRLGSPLLTADAAHTSSDIWTTAVVLVGLSGAVWLKLPWLDVALAIPLCLLLVRVCWTVLRSNLPLLVDQIARGVLGRQVFIDMHMVVDANDLPTAHRITELVEEHLESRFGKVRCTIHLEPREYASPAITFKGTHG